MIRNQFSGETAKDFARELQDLYQAGRALSDISAPIELENYSNATIYSWLQSVSAAMAFFTVAARPVYQRLGLTQIPFNLLKQAEEFFGAVEGGASSALFDVLSEPQSSSGHVVSGLGVPSSVPELHSVLNDDAHDSSSPVGDETSLSTSNPTGEGSPQGAISAFERELLEGETQENLEEEQ